MFVRRHGGHRPPGHRRKPVGSWWSAWGPQSAAQFLFVNPQPSRGGREVRRSFVAESFDERFNRHAELPGGGIQVDVRDLVWRSLRDRTTGGPGSQPQVTFLDDAVVAEDLAQDTFIQAYKSILKTTSELSLKAWLYKIATNNARQFHRPAAAALVHSADRLREVSGTETENSPNSVVERTAIEKALVRVPHEQRVCKALHFVEGLKHREIADIVGVSEEAVRKRVARGSKEFRTVYRAPSGEED